MSEKLLETMNRLGDIIKQTDDSLTFSIFEIGAMPIDGETEVFYPLLEVFPGSKVFAFDVDEKLCEELNQNARHGLRYSSDLIGRTEEERPFYETNDPMCCSLYPPNEELIMHYNNLEVSMLKETNLVETISLDNFVEKNNIDDIDFIKIDVQGAELDIFQGGIKALKKAAFIVSEIEFIPLYKDQPLFGDVSSFLSEQNFMFHKFLSFGGRSLKPITIRNDPNFCSQYMWADAVFIKGIPNLSGVSPSKLLKTGVLSFLYNSPDVAYVCFEKYDEIEGTNIRNELIEM